MSRPRPESIFEIPGAFPYGPLPDSSPAIPDEPSAEFFAAVVAELDRVGVVVKWDSEGRRLCGRAAKTLSQFVLNVFRSRGDGICDYLVRIGRLERPEERPVTPEAGKVVEYVGPNRSLDDSGVCLAEELITKDWVAWRVRGTRTWHAATGYTWDEPVTVPFRYKRRWEK